MAPHVHPVGAMSATAPESSAKRGARRHARHLGAALACVVVGTFLESTARAQMPPPAPSVRAQAPDVPRDLDGEHPVPRLKVSVERFAVGTPAATRVPLTGLHAEVYPVSRPWVRGGIGLAGGAGSGSYGGASASVQYGLLGGSLGAQLPGRVTPFIEGHLRGGFMGATLDRPITVGTVRIENASGTTWMYTRGLDAGAEFYLLGRLYLSGALGWTRATWGSPDTRSLGSGEASTTSQGDLRFVDVTSDSLMWKVGVGI